MLGIWIFGSSLFYKRGLWASKSAGAHRTKILKISGCKRWCPKDLQVRAPAAPVLTHSLNDFQSCYSLPLSAFFDSFLYYDVTNFSLFHLTRKRMYGISIFVKKINNNNYIVYQIPLWVIPNYYLVNSENQSSLLSYQWRLIHFIT